LARRKPTFSWAYGVEEGLGYIPISPAYPKKENRFILKGWGVELRVLGWIFWGYINQSGYYLNGLKTLDEPVKIVDPE
jgi:hypothetical protein